MTAVARKSRDALTRHPWVFDIVDSPSTIGPNAVRHFDQSLQAVASLPGTLTDKLDVLFAVDEYVFGHCLQARNEQPMDDKSPADTAMMDYVAELAGTGEYPQIAALIADHGLESVVVRDGRVPTRPQPLRPQPRAVARRHRPPRE